MIATGSSCLIFFQLICAKLDQKPQVEQYYLLPFPLQLIRLIAELTIQTDSNHELEMVQNQKLIFFFFIK